MKIIKKILFLVLLILAISILITKNKVQAATSGHYTYEENSDGTITITKYDGTAANNLEIPSTIDGKSVTEIGEDAFYHCSGLTGNLTIPNSITSIGFCAFNGCSGLTGNLTIGNSVKYIGVMAFYGCSSLTGNLTIPNSVTNIGIYAFEGCSKIEFINVSNENEYYSSQDGILFNKNKTELIQFPRGMKKNNYSIPNSVTQIFEGAFYHCSGLTGNLTIPNSVTSIGGFAFEGCSGLTGNLTIPNSVTIIGEYAFEGCSGLTGKLTIGNSVTSIGYAAFYGCTGLTGSLVIPNSVTSIGNNAFQGCSGLSGNLDIPDSVINIGKCAFFGCNGFSGDITIGKNVKSIGYGVFAECSKIESINISNENIYYSSQNGILFNKNMTELIQSPVGMKKNNYSIPNSVISIADYAFYGCSGLTGNLTIGNSVTSIGNYAFYGCSGLTGNLTIPNSVTSIGDQAFKECSGLTGKLTIGNSVKIIGSEAFRECKGLTGSLVIPNSVTSIGFGAFFGCSGLTGNLTIGNSVTSIERLAFLGCSGLTGILTIPKSVTSIGDQAFSQCSKLEAINVSSENENYTSQDGILFNKKMTELILCPEGKEKYNYLIPKNVTSIRNYAFENCKGLTGSLTIPNSVTCIEYNAFWLFNTNTNIIFCGIAPEISNYTFWGSYSKIYYPMNKTGYDGEYWPKSQMEAVPFPDVIDKKEWYYDGAEYTLKKGIITGNNDGYGTFRPYEKVTRAMVVTMLYRIEGSPSVTLTNAFPDVPKNEWYAKAVQWAKNNKIVNGYSTGKFGPNDNIKRQDLAIMLLNYAKYKGKYNTSKLNNLDQYKDKNKVDKYAIDGMKWAVGNEIIHGKDSVTLDPTNNATRGETAIMIMNYCKNIFGWK